MEEVLGLEISLSLLLSWSPSGSVCSPGTRKMESLRFQPSFETLLRGVWKLQSNRGFKHPAWCLGSPVLVCEVYIQGSLLKHCMWVFFSFQLVVFSFSFSIQLFLH